MTDHDVILFPATATEKYGGDWEMSVNCKDRAVCDENCKPHHVAKLI